MHIFDQRFWLGDRLYCKNSNTRGQVLMLSNEAALFGNDVEV